MFVGCDDPIVTSYSYDILGRLTKETNQNGEKSIHCATKYADNTYAQSYFMTYYASPPTRKVPNKKYKEK
ncbi:MAG: hypothetical protein FWH48_06970 [Oscillospiraceae bacterium]|nr:hypothetical protein [Oscillospiraceae bacterium]